MSASPVVSAEAEPGGPLAAYRSRVEAGGLHVDAAQEQAALALDRLHRELTDWRPVAPRGRPGRWLGRLLRKEPKLEPPRGIYLWGPVGRGKSMLMDAFFDAVPVRAKRRVHFHDYMLDVHARLHRLRQEGQGEDPLTPLADRLAAEAWLLCFDEFQVEDVADAMILGRLFDRLFARGVVVVATSNTPPDRLYENGLQRPLFLPFIDRLKQRLEVLRLDGGVDYRLDRLRAKGVFFRPLGEETTASLDQAFAALTDGAAGRADVVDLGAGRRLDVPAQAAGVARLHFDALCRSARGAADYIALAHRFHTLVLDGVPRMTPRERNEARRFVTLIDVWYDHRRRLVLGADAPPRELYVEGDGTAAFERTVSRLLEMQSADYLAAAGA